jgi:hypothetical protein
MRSIVFATGSILSGIFLLSAGALATTLASQRLQSDKQIELLVTVVANLFGTVVGAGLAFWFALRQLGIQSRELHAKSLVDTTFELHREFNAGDLAISRDRADRIPAQYPGKNLDDLYSLLPPDERNHLWNVIHFYERLHLAIKHKRVDEALAGEMFGDVFFWWYLNCFEPQLIPIHRDSSRRIAGLKDWFDATNKEEDIARWTQRAKKSSKNAPSEMQQQLPIVAEQATGAGVGAAKDGGQSAG